MDKNVQSVNPLDISINSVLDLSPRKVGTIAKTIFSNIAGAGKRERALEAKLDALTKLVENMSR